jgi:hypothetical protein
LDRKSGTCRLQELAPFAETRGAVPIWATYYTQNYAQNWVELLARDVDVGATGSCEAPRNEGFEHNGAQSGATSVTLLTDGQLTP